MVKWIFGFTIPNYQNNKVKSYSKFWFFFYPSS
ncbi:MAG: hypothetical protein ACI97N_002362, partial [Cognaticolwellia sp.]